MIYLVCGNMIVGANFSESDAYLWRVAFLPVAVFCAYWLLYGRRKRAPTSAE